MVELCILRLGSGPGALDRCREATVFVGLDGEGFLGPRVEGEFDGENNFAAIEVDLAVEGQLEVGARLDHVHREDGIDRGDQRLGGFLADAAVGQHVDQRLAFGQLEGFVGRLRRNLLGDGGDVLLVLDTVDIGIDHHWPVLVVRQVAGGDLGIEVGVVQVTLGYHRTLGIVGLRLIGGGEFLAADQRPSGFRTLGIQAVDRSLLDRGIGVARGGVLAEDAQHGAADHQGSGNAGNTGGQEPAVMGRLDLEWIGRRFGHDGRGRQRSARRQFRRQWRTAGRAGSRRAGAKLSVNAIVQYSNPLSHSHAPDTYTCLVLSIGRSPGACSFVLLRPGLRDPWDPRAGRKMPV